MAFSLAFASLPRPTVRRCVALTAAAGLALTFGLASAAGAADSPLLGATASTYAVLGGTQVTNAGATDVSGNVGVAGTDLSGFPPGTITNGIQHIDDGSTAAAQAELTASFVGPLADAPSTSTLAEVGNQTLVPGVYDTGAIMSLNGTLTLDAGGNSDAVFIFRAGSGLNVAQSSQVVLTNGANACNVFWKVGSTATIGHDADFVGTVEALTAINVDDNATVQGRLLARNAEVTLINDTITSPGSCTVPGGGEGGGGGTSSSSSPTSGSSSSPTSGSSSSPTSGSSSTPTSGSSSTTPTRGTTSTPPLAASNGKPPTVTGVTPGNSSTAGGAKITVTGSGFTKTGTVVRVGGKIVPPSQVTVHNSTTLTFVAPKHTPGTTTFTVTTPNGTSPPHTLIYHRGTTTTTVLAATGSDNGRLLGLAALLVLAGGGVLMAAKRGPRRQTH